MMSDAKPKKPDAAKPKAKPAPMSPKNKPVSNKAFPHAAVYSLCALMIVVLCLILGFNFSKMQSVLAQSEAMQSQYQTMKQSYDGALQATTTLQKQLQDQQVSLNTLDSKLAREAHSKQQAKAEWKAMEAEYLVDAANYALYFNHNGPLAVTLLEQAYRNMSGFNSAAALNVKQALKADLARLAKLKFVNSAEIYLQLQEVSSGLHQIPLLGSEASSDNQTDMEAAAEFTDVAHWKAFWKESLQRIKRLIVVRHNDDVIVPAISRVEQDLYYQYLQLCLSQAEWAVLHHNSRVFHASLESAIDWVQRYFIVTDSHTKAILTQLEQLHKEAWSDSFPELDQSMKAIAAFNMNDGGEADA